MDTMIIGHVSKDINVDCEGNAVQLLGGAVLCACAAAHGLGHRVAALTKLAGEDISCLSAFSIPRESIFALPSRSTTSIKNVYHTPDKEKRTCTCLSQADRFTISDVPDTGCGLYHIAGLIYGDYEEDIIKQLSERGKTAVDVQGFLRHADDGGSMYFEDWRLKKELLPYITYLKTDAAEAEIMTGLSDRYEAARQLHSWGAGEVMITHNTEVIVYDGRDFYAQPLKPRNLSGRTGRGDTTFSAYINERKATGIPESLLMAAATVSLKMETPGPFAASRQDVLDYIRDFY